MKCQTTIGSIARDMLSMYETVLGQRDFGLMRQRTNTTGRRLRFLDQLAQGEIRSRSLSGEDTIDFLEAALDCKALQCATGAQRGVFDALSVGDAKILGRKRVRRGILCADDESVNDWYFALLVRAWVTSKGSVPLRDLREDKRFRGRRVCDFLVEGPDKQVELLECKRVHPGQARPQDVLQVVTAKTRERLQEAGRQLRETADALHSPALCRHALIDISAYDQRPREKLDQVVLTGFEDPAIEGVKTAALTDLADGVDRLTICWRNVVCMEGHTVAITQRTMTAEVGIPGLGFVTYDGWTVEGYPTHWSSYELRVSTIARSLGWIRTSYLSCAKAGFLSCGKVQTPPDNSG